VAVADRLPVLAAALLVGVGAVGQRHPGGGDRSLAVDVPDGGDVVGRHHLVLVADVVVLACRGL